jgi:hypothetical protein
MDEVARLSAQDRADLFQTAATIRGDMRPALVEKDFWVCWTLHHLFSMPDFAEDLVFKGGTSLSKVYGAIDRFSEDVDLSFNRNALGFEGDKDPTTAPSRSQAAKRLEKLASACREMLHARLKPRLEAAFITTLGTSRAKGNWRIEQDVNDPDGQTLVFHYPTGIAGEGVSQPVYLRPAIRLEFGARGAQWPTEWAEVTPYAAQSVPQPFKTPSCRVKALSAERTFWEKATLLHMVCHFPVGKPLPERLSRHYYDLAKLYGRKEGKKAVADLGLLRSVADHKFIFFSSSAARYDLAVPGTLRLVPPPHRIKVLEDDYVKMREMIFNAPPRFEDLLKVIRDIERLVNEGIDSSASHQ